MCFYYLTAFLTLFRERQAPRGACRERNLAQYDFVILVPHEHACPRQLTQVSWALGAAVKTLECPKHAFRLRLGRIFLDKFLVFFTTKNLQLVYPPFDMAPLMRIPMPNCV